jgi:hypothetical protein
MNDMQFLDITEFQKQMLKNWKVHVNVETFMATDRTSNFYVHIV